MIKSQTLTYSDWIDKFIPVVDEHGEPRHFETYGTDLREVLDTDHNRVWTLMDGDGGELFIGNGYHLVNRQAYYITEKPFGEDEDIQILD